MDVLITFCILVLCVLYLKPRLGAARLLIMLALFASLASAYFIVKRIGGHRAQLWFSILFFTAAACYHFLFQRRAKDKK